MIFNKGKACEFIEFNPKETLKKNQKYRKIAMENIIPNYKFIEKYSFEEYKGGCKFKNGDTIFARITPCLENGKIAFVNCLEDNEISFGSTEYIVLRAIENKTIPEFVYYYSISDYFKNKAISLMTGTSGRQRVQTDALKELEVKIPNIAEQQKIVKVLSNIDRKIKLNNEINNNLHDLVESIFNKYNESASDGKLDYLVDIIQTGSRPKGGAQTEGIPSIGAEKIEKFGIYDYSSEKYISEDYFEKLKNGIVKSKDVLLYKDGAYTGKVSMALNGFPHDKCAVNEHVFILRTKELYAQNYLYFTLNNKEIKEKLYMLACGKAAQPGLNQIELKSIDIKLIDKDKIIEFENKVSPIMEKIALNSLMNKNLSQLRDTLLPKLMNGEIDLDNIEI